MSALLIDSKPGRKPNPVSLVLNCNFLLAKPVKSSSSITIVFWVLEFPAKTFSVDHPKLMRIFTCCSLLPLPEIELVVRIMLFFFKIEFCMTLDFCVLLFLIKLFKRLFCWNLLKNTGNKIGFYDALLGMPFIIVMVAVVSAETDSSLHCFAFSHKSYAGRKTRAVLGKNKH